jgi:hypothetical protein
MTLRYTTNYESQSVGTDGCVRPGHGAPHGAVAATRDTGREPQRRTAGPSTGACRAQIDASLDAALRGVQDLAHAGKLDKARDALGKLDGRFGGLAAPRSVELAESLNAP